MLPSPAIGVIGVPDGGAIPCGGIGCPGFDGALPLLAAIPAHQDAILLISLCFCPLKFLLCFRMLIFHPFGFDRNWIWWTLCRPLFLHNSSKLFTALVISSATDARSTGYLSRISARFRFTVAIKLPSLLLTFPDSSSFPPVLNSSAVHCKQRTLQSY